MTNVLNYNFLKAKQQKMVEVIDKELERISIKEEH